MELKVQPQKQRTGAARMPQKADTPAAKTEAPPVQQQNDRLQISRAAVDFLEAQSSRQREQILAALRQSRPGEKAAGENSMLDALGRQMKIMEKCRKIAARIMAGDKVPQEDMNYLQEHDPMGYKLAMAMRRPKKDPKEWDSLLDDEDRKSRNNAAAGGMPGMELPTPAGPGTGADCAAGGEEA